MKPNIKKLLIRNAPYLLFVYLFDKVGQAVRLSPGADLSGKLLSIGSGFSAAFSNALSLLLCRYGLLARYTRQWQSSADTPPCSGWVSASFFLLLNPVLLPLL